MPLTCLQVSAQVFSSEYINALLIQNITNLARIASLLLELTHGSLLRRLAFVDQAGGEFNAEGLDGRTVLDDDHRAHGFAGVLENRHNGYGVYARGLAGLASGSFPDALLAVL